MNQRTIATDRKIDDLMNVSYLPTAHPKPLILIPFRLSIVARASSVHCDKRSPSKPTEDTGKCCYSDLHTANWNT